MRRPRHAARARPARLALAVAVLVGAGSCTWFVQRSSTPGGGGADGRVVAVAPLPPGPPLPSTAPPRTSTPPQAARPRPPGAAGRATTGLPSVTAAFSDQRVRLGRSVRLSGVVRPATAGTRVERQQRVESEWVGLDRSTVSARGRFRFEVTPRSPGRKQYRVVVLSGKGRGTASPAVRLIVR